jgi:translation initiation factor 2 subunit 3
MATNGDFSDESLPGSPNLDATNAQDFDDQELLDEKPLKSAMKKSAAPPPEAPKRPWLPELPDPNTLDLSTLTPLSPEVIARQATQNIGTIGKAAICRTCYSQTRLLTKFDFNRARRAR